MRKIFCGIADFFFLKIFKLKSRIFFAEVRKSKKRIPQKKCSTFFLFRRKLSVFFTDYLEKKFRKKLSHFAFQSYLIYKYLFRLRKLIKRLKLYSNFFFIFLFRRKLSVFFTDYFEKNLSAFRLSVLFDLQVSF